MSDLESNFHEELENKEFQNDHKQVIEQMLTTRVRQYYSSAIHLMGMFR